LKESRVTRSTPGATGTPSPNHYSRRSAGSHLPAGLDPSIAKPCRPLAGPKNLIAHRGEMQHIEALRGKFKFHIVLVSARLFAEK
jgi:hypothetical protein